MDSFNDWLSSTWTNNPHILILIVYAMFAIPLSIMLGVGVFDFIYNRTKNLGEPEDSSF